jgi:HSP20 family protein
MSQLEVKKMRLTVWDPFREVVALERATDRFFRDVPTRRRHSYPPLELEDKGDNVTITAGLPGVDKETVELTVLGDTLTIAGEKKSPTDDGAKYIRHERAHGKFRRLVHLPYAVAQDDIKASYKDGVLTITLPKAEEAKARQIAVE